MVKSIIGNFTWPILIFLTKKNYMMIMFHMMSWIRKLYRIYHICGIMWIEQFGINSSVCLKLKKTHYESIFTLNSIMGDKTISNLSSINQMSANIVSNKKSIPSQNIQLGFGWVRVAIEHLDKANARGLDLEEKIWNIHFHCISNLY